MTEFDKRVSSIIIELNALEKILSNKMVVLNVMCGLPNEWDVKITAMRESKDLNKLELHDLFADLKAYGFELHTREEDQSTSQLTKALSAVKLEPRFRWRSQLNRLSMMRCLCMSRNSESS